MTQKVLTVLLLLTGEILTILIELFYARSAGKEISTKYSLFSYLGIFIAGVFLIQGYRIGQSAFNNIWVIVAVSLTSILVVEPILAMVIFSDKPTLGSIIGFTLGLIGMVCSLTIK